MPTQQDNVSVRVALKAARRQWCSVARVRCDYARTRPQEQTGRFVAQCRAIIRSQARRYVIGQRKADVLGTMGLAAAAAVLFATLPVPAAGISLIALAYACVVLVVAVPLTIWFSDEVTLSVGGALVVCTAGLAYLRLGRPPLSYSWFVSQGWHQWLVLAVLIAPLWLVVMVLVLPLTRPVELWLRSRRTDEAVGVTLLELVGVAFEVVQPDFATSIRRKQAVIEELEHAAFVVRDRLVTAFRVRDPAQREAVAERFECFARALESEVLVVANPKPDTETQLLDRLLGSIQCLSEGCFDCLPSLDEAPEARRRRLRSTLGRALLLVLIAAVPVACVLLAPHVGLPLDGDPAAVLRVGVVAWAIVFLLLAFDRSIDRKVDQVKNVLSVFRKAA